MLRYLFNIFLILFFYEGSNLYESSWIKVTRNDSNIYKFHEENAASVSNLKKRLRGNTEKHTNTAYIGISIIQKETILTFPICEKVIFSAHTIDSYPSDIDNIIAIPDLVQTSRINPMKKTCVTERKFFTVINLLSVLNKDEYKYKKAINNIINSSTNDRKIDLDSIRSKDNGIDNYLKDFLHCEQIILLHILNNTSLFREVLEENIKNIPDVKKIKKITLDIITYIDMCPKCFATCEFFFDNLKNIILSNLFPEHSADDIPFQIIISSLQPYKIAAPDKFTRNSHNNNTWLDVFYAEPSHYTENTEGKIIQFANPWLMELDFRDIFEKLQISIDKALSFENLDTLHIKIEALKNISIDKDINNYNFQELHNNFRKKYLSLFENYLCNLVKSNVNLISQISSYGQELLDESRDRLLNALKQIQNQTESIHGEQQEEFEHNNNTKN